MTDHAPREGSRSTRQLLDDLDVLMNRMLTLPVEHADANPSSSEIVKVDLSAYPALGVQLTVLEPEVIPAPMSTDTQLNIGDSWPMGTYELPRPASKGPDWIDAESVLDEGQVVDAGPPSTTALATIQPASLAKLPPRSLFLRRPYAMAVRLNLKFNRMTRSLGLLGRLLRSEVARAVFGIVGLAAIVFTIVFFSRF